MLNECRYYESYSYSTLGYTYFHSGRFKEAEYYLNLALQKDEYNSLAALYLSKYYSRINDHEKRKAAIAILKKHSPFALNSFN